MSSLPFLFGIAFPSHLILLLSLIQTFFWFLAMLLIPFSLIIGAICFVNVVMVAIFTHHLASFGVFFFSPLLSAYHRVLLLPFSFQLRIHNMFCLSFVFYSVFLSFFSFCGQWDPGVCGTDGLHFSSSVFLFILCCFQFSTRRNAGTSGCNWWWGFLVNDR
jgi:hypothetical protein